jgi:hypothetical protein
MILRESYINWLLSSFLSKLSRHCMYTVSYIESAKKTQAKKKNTIGLLIFFPSSVQYWCFIPSIYSTKVRTIKKITKLFFLILLHIYNLRLARTMAWRQNDKGVLIYIMLNNTQRNLLILLLFFFPSVLSVWLVEWLTTNWDNRGTYTTCLMMTCSL